MKKFHTYQQAVDYLVQELPKTDRTAKNPAEKLSETKRVMNALGNPQNAHPAIHIAGTSGKGTICYLVDSILRAHTIRCGLIQSPHVYDIRERIQLNGQLISERKFLEYTHTVIQAFHQEGVTPTYRAVLTAMGFVAFQKTQLDYAVIEVGFGGKFDRTNIITREDKLAVLGQIGFDHTDTLGNTLREIAGEKAGIVQPHNRVIALRQDPEVVASYEEALAKAHASVEWVEQKDDYQQTNDAMAIQICQTLADRDGWKLDTKRTKEVLETAFIPGRFEKREYKDHLVILDGAHNPQKLAALANRLKREERAPITCILSLGHKKEYTECLKILKPVVKRIIATEYFANMKHAPFRPIPAEEIVASCKKLGIDATAQPSPQLALKQAVTFPEPIVATGSFFILGEVDAAF